MRAPGGGTLPRLGQGGQRPRYSGLTAQTFQATHDFFVTEW